MGYTSNNLSLRSGVIGGGAPRQWDYFTADSLDTVLGAAYFSDATKKGMLLGDVVHVFSGTLNTALTASPSTADVGAVSRFSAAPQYTVCAVSAIASGAATVVGMEKSAITDNSGGSANAATGIAATLATQLITFYTTLASLANSQVIQALPGFNGKITAANFHTRVAATTAAKAATATAQINGTNITTGGVIALTSAACTPTGTVVAGSAVTAQAFTKTQPIGFNISSVTAFVEGDGYLELVVVNTDLADAIATLIKY